MQTLHFKVNNKDMTTNSNKFLIFIHRKGHASSTFRASHIED